MPRKLSTFLVTLAAVAFAAPAAQAACPDAGVQPAAGNMPAVKAATLCLINEQRTAAGLAAVRENATLTRASDAYSAQMVSQRFFAHVTPDGTDLLARLTDIGYLLPSADDYVLGENLAWGQTYLATPGTIVDAWMHSPGHRANILQGEYREIGLGIVLGTPAQGPADDGATYTTDFGRLGSGSAPVAAAEPARTATTTKRTAKASCRSARKARTARARKAAARRCAAASHRRKLASR
jgi:uncharacterized protein YkwD